MSHLLEILGRGLDDSISQTLARYYWSPCDKSLEELEAICRQHPDWPDANLQLGLNYLRAMETDRAICSLGLACKHNPDDLAARLALASAYEEHGDLAGAMEQLKVANHLRVGESAILFAIGYCSEKLRQPAQAADYYRGAIASNEAFGAARERLAAVAIVLGQLDEAITQYEILTAERPQESWLRTSLAHLYAKAGNYRLAIQNFETAIAMEPANWSLVDDEVETLVADGQIREAIERLDSLIEQQGPFADLHLRLADLYSQIGDDDQATRNYLAARESQPNYLEAAVKLGTHHLTFGRWDQAAESFLEATELNDRLLVNYVGMGVAQYKSGDHCQAVKSFELATAVEPNSSMLLAEMARLQLKAAVADDFMRNFEDGDDTPTVELEMDNDHLLSRQMERHEDEVNRHPGHADLRYRYGVLLRAEGKLGEAVEQLSKAVEINPSYVQAIIKLGITQQELGRSDEAIATFLKALEIKPEFVDLHYRLGLLYTDRRQFEHAIKEMEAAATGAPDNEQIRAGLALSLQNMGLMDRAAATWRSLWKLHRSRPVKPTK